MDSASAPAFPLDPVAFEDGLGRRHVTMGATEPLEVLTVREELASSGTFESALRDRVTRLSEFRSEHYARVRSVERTGKGSAQLTLVSEHVPGIRLSDILSVAERQLIPVETNAALCLIRQMVHAITVLHDKVPDTCHGAIGPERLILTPQARLVVAEYVFGSALEQLRYSNKQYWHDLRVPLPRTFGMPTFDRRADVTQIGATALALILGRPLAADEFPAQIGEMTDSALVLSPTGGLEPLPLPLRVWLQRAMQVDSKMPFSSALDAWAELDRVLHYSDPIAEVESLKLFMARYYNTVGAQAAPEPRPAARPASPLAVTPPPSARAPKVTSAPAGSPAPKTSPASQIPPSPRTPLGSKTGTAVPVDQPERARPAVATEPVPTRGASSQLATKLPTPNLPTVESPAPLPAKVPADKPTSVAPVTPPVPPPAPSPLGAAIGKEAGGFWNRPAAVDTPPEHPPVTVTRQSVPARRKLSRLHMAAAAALLVTLAVGTVAARRYFAQPVPADGMGSLVVQTNPSGATVEVDGQSLGVTPLSIDVQPGRHTLKLSNGGNIRSMPITITAGGQVSQFIDLPRASAVLGELRVRTEPAGAIVTVDGHDYGQSPLTVEGLSPGVHTVVLKSALGSVTQDVKVEAGTAASLVVPLAPPKNVPVSGWIAVTAPTEVEIYEGGQLIGTSQSQRIMVSAGRHSFQIVNEALGYRETRDVTVAPGRVAKINPAWPTGTMSFNATPWAEVWVDGRQVGETPLGNVTVPIGSHNVLFRHPELGEKSVTVRVNAGTPAKVSVDLRQQ